MELLLNYLLKSGLCLLAMYLFYYAALRKQPNFAFNRVYLLAATPLALAIPFMKWPVSFATEAVVGYGLRTIQLPEITITATLQDTAPDPFFAAHNVAYFLAGVYALVAVILFFKLVQQLWQIRTLIKSATPVQVLEPGITVLQVPAQTASFAFLHKIFISDQSYLTDAEKQQVLSHELAHVQLKHTLDILYFEILTTLLWFNPMVWLLKNELRDVHEFQADARVLANHQVSAYSTLLAKEALYISGVPVGSYFKEPQVLKRLQMLQRYNKHSSWVRPVLLFPVLIGLAFTFSSQQRVSTEPGLLPAEPLSPKPEPKLIPVSKETIDKQKAKTTQDEEKPYAYVEQMPQFEGGERALQKFIGSNISYPVSSREAGKQGLVFIGFTVTKEGKLTDFELQKGIDEALDTEAMRIIKLTADKWIPGKQNGKAVPVRFTIPIRFSLN